MQSPFWSVTFGNKTSASNVSEANGCIRESVAAFRPLLCPLRRKNQREYVFAAMCPCGCSRCQQDCGWWAARAWAEDAVAALARWIFDPAVSAYGAAHGAVHGAAHGRAIPTVPKGSGGKARGKTRGKTHAGATSESCSDRSSTPWRTLPHVFFDWFKLESCKILSFWNSFSWKLFCESAMSNFAVVSHRDWFLLQVWKCHLGVPENTPQSRVQSGMK